MKLSFLGDDHFDQKSCGKKALNLHLLKREGLPVPGGFVVLPEQNLELQDVHEAIKRIGGFPVAVRSSGFFEDSDLASFAGQYVSFLEIISAEDVVAKIRDCRTHAASDHLKKYSQERGLGDVDTAKMTVLIQKMVPAARAGVSFSIHPLSGKEEESLHEVCQGLGENLVSGQVIPTQYVFDFWKDQIVQETAGQDNVILTHSELTTLSKICWQASAYFGSPQDIEWAFDNSGQFFLLQSRPITKVQFRTDISEMTNADLRDGGVSAKVCTPLMASLYKEAFDSSMQDYMTSIRLFKEQAQVPWMLGFYGRVYWDAALVKRCLFKIPGFDEKSFDEDLGIQKAYGSNGPVVISSNDLKIILGAIPVAVSLEIEFSKCLKMTDAFSKEYENKFKFWNNQISLLNKVTAAGSVYTLFDQFIREMFLWTERSYFTTIYNNSNLQTLFKDSLRKLEQKLGTRIAIEKLIAGLTDISHLQMQKDFISLYEAGEKYAIGSTEWKTALSKFIRHNYFHSDTELDITVPRWEECPEVIEKRVVSMLRAGTGPANPDQTSLRQAQQCESEFLRICEEIGKKQNPISAALARRRLRGLLKKVRTYLSRREKMREYSTRTYYLVRKFVLGLAEVLKKEGRLAEESDIFQLNLSEILIEIKKTPENASQRLSALIQKRKLIYRGFQKFQAPNEFGQGIVQTSAPDINENEQGLKMIKGLGCSAGVIEATARVILSIEEIHTIQQGEVVITRFTDPSWTPVLGMIKGVVTEVGGLLSHAAVISREYGIPAVLNAIGATQVIKTGQRIRLNGTTGEIVILRDPQ